MPLMGLSFGLWGWSSLRFEIELESLLRAEWDVNEEKKKVLRVVAGTCLGMLPIYKNVGEGEGILNIEYSDV